jgi:hypothetical protein
MASDDLTTDGPPPYANILPSVFQLSNIMRDNSWDDAIGVLGDTGRYHATFIQPQHVDASRSTFNNVRGIQNNVVNVTVSQLQTIVDYSTSHPLHFNHEALQCRL